MLCRSRHHSIGGGSIIASTLSTFHLHCHVSLTSSITPYRIDRPLRNNATRFVSSSKRPLNLRQVPHLATWDKAVFQSSAYGPGLPYRLPGSAQNLPPACTKWFVHHDDGFENRTLGSGEKKHTTNSHQDNNHDEGNNFGPPLSSELQTSFWSEFEDTLVPLELTSRDARGNETFHRTEAPLKVLLTYLSSYATAHSTSHPQSHSIYLAQCSLSSLPLNLQADVPIPALLTKAIPSTAETTSTTPPPSAHIKGDIYATSLWLGRAPTYTPLHRDPNPNLFVQLAGSKTIRLLPPSIGDAIFEDIQSRLSSSPSSSARIRGEEMMQGPEKAMLDHAIWPDNYPSPADSSSQARTSKSTHLPNSNSTSDLQTPDSSARYTPLLQRYAQESTLHMGDTLFIPRGWWHSVRGIGHGVTASANWWFR